MPRVSKEKNREYQRKWYKQNKQLQIDRNAANQKRKKQWLVEYKCGKSCHLCGEDHPATLDFHHRDPNNKLIGIANIARRNWSLERITEEVAKCDLICANCHRKLHYKERNEAEW